MGLFKKSMDDHIRDFYSEHGQYNIAQIAIYEKIKNHLESRLGQKKYNIITDESILATASAQIIKYLLGNDISNYEDVSDNIKKEMVLVKNKVEIWADEIMLSNKALCNLVISTLRMVWVYETYMNDTKWLIENPKGIRVNNIVQKYGNDVDFSPDPKTYKKLLKIWMKK